MQNNNTEAEQHKPHHSLKRKLDHEEQLSVHNNNKEGLDARENQKKLKESSTNEGSTKTDIIAQPERLSILIMSDIHNYDIYFERVRKILDKNQVKVDVVLCPGDIVNIKTKEEYKSKEFQFESLKSVEKIAEGMLSFAPKVYLIPGNVCCI